MKLFIKIITIYLTYVLTILGYGGPPPPLLVSSNISGLPHRAPLFLKDTNNVTIFTRFSFFTPPEVNGFTNVDGTSFYNSDLEDKNLNWDIPTAALNVGIDIKLWEWSTLFASLQLDSRRRGSPVSGFDIGIGLVTSADNDFRGRLDLGLTYNYMEMKTILFSDDIDTSYFVVTDNRPGLNPFISMTMNTAFKDWAINPFFQVSYCSETLFNIAKYYEDIYSRIDLYTITPGITYRLSETVIMIVGGSYFIPSGLNNRSSQALFSGFAQVNFLLE
jgi:hypothetical protein